MPDERETISRASFPGCGSRLTKPLLTTLAAEPYPICVDVQKLLISRFVTGMGPALWEMTW
jgi:hypothetical protein